MSTSVYNRLATANPDLISPEARRAHLGGLLFKAGVPWSALGLAPLGVSEVINASFQPCSEWPAGILQNSRYRKFIVFEENGHAHLESLCGCDCTRPRATKLKSFDHLCALLVKWAADNAQPKKDT